MKYKYDGPKRTHARTDADYQQYTVKIESKVRNQCIQRMPTEYLISRQSLMDTNDKIIRIRIRRTFTNLRTNARKLRYRPATVNNDDENIDPYDEYQTNIIPDVDAYWIQTTNEQRLTTTITHDDKNIDPYDEYQTNIIPDVDDKWIQTTSTNEIEYKLLQTIWMTGK
ncbi:hypothetical protein CLU79DRAFT_885715 [Phycomyces nitens]|nr:hypothetical protein CLU79DRAFT_885715 [Phycomyces nitens]